MPANNLPTQLTSFIGREKELAEIAALLADPTCRLLTLVGPGGIGKTRLAIQTANDQQPLFVGGVYFIPLAPVGSSDLLVSAITTTLKISFFGTEEPRIQLVRYLSEKHLLLVMDNFEHVLEGADLLTHLLQAAPSLKILVTSRERLNLKEEWVFALEGLSYPTENVIDPLENYGAVQLFIHRARQAQVQFSFEQNAQAVLTICRYVEGLPLGLEMAASWLRSMSCDQIITQISNSFDFLSTPLRNIPERHRSLRRVFEQSWNLLSADEQRIMMRLSVFRGGFDQKAAQAVAEASLPLLANLIDKSLIRLHNSGRYDIHEMLRQYAAERLTQAQELNSIAQRHFDYFAQFADEAERSLFGAYQTIWFDKLEIEWGNLRTALAFALNSEMGLHLAASLGWFFGERPYWNEGLSWLEHALAANPEASALLRAKASHNAAALAGHLGDKERLNHYCEEAIVLAQTTQDEWSIAWALAHLGFFSVFHPNYDVKQLASYLEKSVAIFRQLGDQMGLAHSLVRSAWNALDQQNFPYAYSLIEEAGSLADKVGDTIIIAWVNKTLGNIAQDNSNSAQARTHLTKSLEYFRQAKLPEACNMITIDLADLEIHVKNFERAEELYKESIILHRTSLLNHPPIPDILAKIAHTAQIRNQLERAAQLLGAAHAWGIGRTATLIPNIDGFETEITTVREQMEQMAFEEAWTIGKAMTREQAIAYALEDSTPTVEIPEPSRPIDPLLTERELEILHLIADGLNSREIAQQLVLSVGTIRWYLKIIYEKLDVHSRSEAIARAKTLHILA